VSDSEFYRHRKTETAKKLINDELKTACVLDSSGIKYLDFLTKGKFTYTLISQRLISDFYGFALPKDYFLNDEFNRRTVQLLESGIIKGIFDKYYRMYGAKGWKAESEGPQVLTFDHLEFWFELWLVLIIVCSLSFVVEHLTKIIALNIKFCVNAICYRKD
jgi:hypothetical protein